MLSTVEIIDPELGITRNWNIGPVDHVFMTFENTLRYPLGVESGDDDWDASLPAGGGMIRLGKDKEEYSISMFHQLRCLAIIRNDINRVKGMDNPVPGKLTQHCMDYLRQMVLCRADLRLESARNPYGPRIAVSDVTHSCKDWKTVYRAAEDNYQGIK